MSINEVLQPEELHPAGEGNFTFSTAGGRMRLSVTEDALTPFGGLVPWAAYSQHIGIAEKLAADCPVKRTSPNAALFGMESVVGDDTVRRFFKSVDPVLGTEWIARNIKPMWGALPD